MDEELEARRKFLDTVSPYFEALPNRPPRRAGNISRVELLGRKVWSKLNHYLVLATIDTEIAPIDQELSELLPKGSRVSILGTFESLHAWQKARSA
jgi:hypothetical protein